jgi:hypothetical protein
LRDKFAWLSRESCYWDIATGTAVAVSWLQAEELSRS